MTQASDSIRDLARQLLAVEATSQSATGAHMPDAMRVCEKLRISLTRLAGADGFAMLMRRALALARTEARSMRNIEIGADGSLEGCEALAVDSSNGELEVVAIIAHLLELLETFIGKAITLRLVREGWPGASLDY